MPLLGVSGLKKSYQSPDGARSPVIDIDSFELDESQQVAIQGTSGCGKTTFLHLIAGILQSDSGSVRIAGDEIAAAPETARDRIRGRHIGYIFQAFHLLPAYSALENVLLGMAFSSGVDVDFARSLLERVGLSDRMDYRPPQLSIGQQQRVAVARALANRPRLVLADEPTGSLDPHHAGEALALIRSMCEENHAALLLVSHDGTILEQFESRVDFSEINRA